MAQVEVFTFNGFQENTYVLYDNSGECVIVDPGCYERTERDTLKRFILVEELKPVRLIQTHCHIDHVLGSNYISREFGLTVEIHEKEETVLESCVQVASMYGFTGYEPVEKYSTNLVEGDKITFGNSSLEILWVPGHAPGHVVFVDHESKYIVNGDCLFQMSIGRTDLPGGDHDTLLQKIKEKLFQLPDDYVVHCGHGPSTNIGFEKANNPFLK